MNLDCKGEMEIFSINLSKEFFCIIFMYFNLKKSSQQKQYGKEMQSHTMEAKT